jgi:hypothetical protein
MSTNNKEQSGKTFAAHIGIAFFYVLLWTLQPLTVLSLLIVAPVAGGLWAVVERFPRKNVLYACSGVVLLLAVVGTVGIVSSNSRTVSSEVLKKWTEQRFASIGASTHMRELHLVKVACEDSERGYLMADLGSQSYNRLHVGEQVELSYHAESILGVWGRQLVVASIDSQVVSSGGGRGFHGGSIDKFLALVTLMFGIFPLSYLIYKDYIKHS